MHRAVGEMHDEPNQYYAGKNACTEGTTNNKPSLRGVAKACAGARRSNLFQRSGIPIQRGRLLRRPTRSGPAAPRNNVMPDQYKALIAAKKGRAEALPYIYASFGIISQFYFHSGFCSIALFSDISRLGIGNRLCFSETLLYPRVAYLRLAGAFAP